MSRGQDSCPECRGIGHHSTGPFCDARYEHEMVMLCDCGGPAVLTTCRVCKGSGKLVGVARAVYIARGGAAPVQRGGFA